jgi:hypothetical protein
MAAEAVRNARTWCDHVAGRLGVALTDMSSAALCAGALASRPDHRAFAPDILTFECAPFCRQMARRAARPGGLDCSPAQEGIPATFHLSPRPGPMVDVQIAGSGVREPYVLEAPRRVPREAFVEPGFEAFAYEGRLTGHQKRCQIITAARRLALGDIMLGSLGGTISERPGGFIGSLKKETVEDERSCLQHHRDRRNIENQRRGCCPAWH